MPDGCEQCGSYIVTNHGDGPRCGRCGAYRVQFMPGGKP